MKSRGREGIRVYSPKLTERGFKKHIARMIISSLIRDFLEEMNETLKELKLI